MDHQRVLVAASDTTLVEVSLAGVALSMDPAMLISSVGDTSKHPTHSITDPTTKGEGDNKYQKIKLCSALAQKQNLLHLFRFIRSFLHPS